MLFFVIYTFLLAVVVVYDHLLRFNLNVNTFRIFIYLHFYVIFFVFVFYFLYSTIFPIHVTHYSSALVRHGESKRSIIFTEEIELSK